MGIIPLFRIRAPQISLQRQLTNVFRLLLALIMSEKASCIPLFILGERYISDNESPSWNFYARVWESEELYLGDELVDDKRKNQ